MAYPLNAKVQAVGEINFAGNIVPDNWSKWLLTKSGKTSGCAMLLLSEIVYWYRPTVICHESSGEAMEWGRKFKADMPQKSYGAIAQKWGYSVKQIRDAAKILKDVGVVKTVVRTIKPSVDLPAIPNVMFWDLDPVKLKEITFESPQPNDSNNVRPSDLEVTWGDAEVRGGDAEVRGGDAEVAAHAVEVGQIHKITTEITPKTSTFFLKEKSQNFENENEGTDRTRWEQLEPSRDASSSKRQTGGGLAEGVTVPPRENDSQIDKVLAIQSVWNKVAPEKFVRFDYINPGLRKKIEDAFDGMSTEESCEVALKALAHASVTDWILSTKKYKTMPIEVVLANNWFFQWAQEHKSLDMSVFQEAEEEFSDPFYWSAYHPSQVYALMRDWIHNRTGISRKVIRELQDEFISRKGRTA